MMLLIKKKLFLLLLFFYFLGGSLNSIKSGISFDENYEELNWKFHVSLVKDITLAVSDKKKFDRKKFDQEVKRFVGYGIGFQIISQPIQYFLKDLLIQDKNLDTYGAKLLAKHFVVFLFFFISGIFFYLILRKIIDHENFCSFSTIIYFLYPYLFGQSMFSPKDIPFMSIWVMCTYISFLLFEKIIENKKLNFKLIFFISITTAYLLSIRIAGLLIFVQYLITFSILVNISKFSTLYFIKNYYKYFFIFLFVFLFCLFIFYPIFWINPLLIIDTFNINIKHFNNVGTNTLGELMYSKNLPATYLPIWLIVKIPILILFGFVILPFSEKKIFENKKKTIYFGSILLTIFLIPLLLIVKKVHLYDEIRQVMFLIPLIFIVGLVSLYVFSVKFFYVFGTLTIILFSIENIKINPYQYVWFNLPARYLDLSKNFELEYQGISGRQISVFLKNFNEQSYCILANPLHSIKHFLNDTKYNCFDIWQKIDTNYKRPFLAVQNVRNLKKSSPFKCITIHESSFNLLFHKKIITGKVLKCE